MKYEEKRLKNLDKFMKIENGLSIETYLKNMEDTRQTFLKQNRGSTRIDLVKCAKQDSTDQLIKDLNQKQEQIMVAFKTENRII